MGNLSGVPAIPIGTRSKKLSETYDELDGYPLPAIDPGKPSWVGQITGQIGRVFEDNDVVGTKGNRDCGVAGEIAFDGITGLFSTGAGAYSSLPAEDQAESPAS